jgi:hypothetical protein
MYSCAFLDIFWYVVKSNFGFIGDIFNTQEKLEKAGFYDRGLILEYRTTRFVFYFIIKKYKIA